jgi:hypothetical protein
MWSGLIERNPAFLDAKIKFCEVSVRHHVTLKSVQVINIETRLRYVDDFEYIILRI